MRRHSSGHCHRHSRYFLLSIRGLCSVSSQKLIVMNSTNSAHISICTRNILDHVVIRHSVKNLVNPTQLRRCTMASRFTGGRLPWWLLMMMMDVRSCPIHVRCSGKWQSWQRGLSRLIGCYENSDVSRSEKVWATFGAKQACIILSIFFVHYIICWFYQYGE